MLSPAAGSGTAPLTAGLETLIPERTMPSLLVPRHPEWDREVRRMQGPDTKCGAGRPSHCRAARLPAHHQPLRPPWQRQRSWWLARPQGLSLVSQAERAPGCWWVCLPCAVLPGASEAVLSFLLPE